MDLRAVDEYDSISLVYHFALFHEKRLDSSRHLSGNSVLCSLSLALDNQRFRL